MQIPALAAAYHERWEHETGNAQLKTYLRGPGKVLRSKSPEMIRQEIWGYLLTHYAISALICTAASAACGAATSLGMLIAFRVVQATGAALLTPSSLSLVLATTAPEKRHGAVRAWTAVGGAAFTLHALLRPYGQGVEALRVTGA